MSTGLIFDNLIAYSLEIGMLVGVAAFVPALLRMRQPGAKLVYWQMLLVACLLLPLQPWQQVVLSGSVQISTTAAAFTPLRSAPTTHMLPRSEIALMVLLAGMVIRIGWLATGFWKLRRYRRHSTPLDPAPSWSVEASLLVSEDVASPVTFGWRKPVVLLPAGFTELNSQTQEAILCHEVMHVRRRDWLFTVVEEVVRAIFWFHPAIWWLLGEIGLAREQQVDRLAIEITNERDHYMDALLAIAGARAQLDLAPAPLFLRKRHLKHRVVSILKETHMSKQRLISTLVTGFGILAGACWLVTGVFPLTAQPQIVDDSPGVTVNLNGAVVMHRTGVGYPSAVLKKGIQGMLSVELKTDAAGNVSDAHVLSGPDELRRSTLESVLQWHFTRAFAGTTRTVQITFEAPKEMATAAEVEVRAVPGGVVGGVIGGVPGGTRGGVLGGIIGSVPAGMAPPPPPPPPPSAEAMAQARIAGIRILGLPDQERAELLASLPIREGDQMDADLQQRTVQAMRAFDEHLTLSRMYQRAPDGALTQTVTIAAPGAMRGAVSSQMRTFAPMADGSTPINVGGNIQSAKILRKVQPAYPALAMSARVSGVVQLAVVIAKDGTIQEIHSLGGPALLIQSAMDAVKQWLYSPTLVNNQPVAVATTIDLNFSLDQ